jgi:dienelactone hydrolase
MHTETIEYAAGETELEGYLAVADPGAGRRPGVVVAHAWRGRDAFADSRAQRLAELGYVGFAADVYGRGLFGTTDERARSLMEPLVADRRLLRQRIGAAVRTLAAHQTVDPRRIAAIGFCFGGLTVLELARGGAEVRGVVSFHGLLAPGPVAARHIGCKVLALHGHDDPLVPPGHVAAFASEMTAAGADWQMVVYGGAMHAFTNPAANEPARGLRYDASADRRSWRAMETFLEEILA